MLARLTCTGAPYDHPWLQYAAANTEEDGTGCTDSGTRVLVDEGLAAEHNSQFFIQSSFGRFSFYYEPAILNEIPDPSDGEEATLRQHPDCTIPEGSDNNGGCNYQVDGADKPAFYRHYLLYEEMNPGSGMSGVGGGKKSQISGCDYSVGWMNSLLTAHEMGHAFDLAHAEMWSNTDTDKKIMKDPGCCGSPYTEYQDYWSVMGNGVDTNEYDKLRMGWIVEQEFVQILDEDRDVVHSPAVTHDAITKDDDGYIMSLYPIDRAESKGNLMMLVFEESNTNVDKLLNFVCVFRQWPGHPGGESKLGGRDGAWGRDDNKDKDRRYIKNGLSCLRSMGNSKSLSREDFRIDFNVLDGDIVETLPSSAGGDPAGNSNVGLSPGKTWYHPFGKWSISVLNMGPDSCDKETAYPLYDEWGQGAFECMQIKLKTGLPERTVMGRKVSIGYEFADNKAYLCDGTVCAVSGKVGCGAVAVKTTIKVTLSVDGEDGLQPEAIAWKDGKTGKTFAAGSLIMAIPLEPGRTTTMTASYDDATQARLAITVTEQTQSTVSVDVKTTLLHNDGSEWEEGDIETTSLSVDVQDLDLGGARGISLFDESGDKPSFSDGFEAESIGVGDCKAVTVTLKADLSSFGAGDAVFAMYDSKIKVPYMLTTLEVASGYGSSGRTIKVCWLDGQECQSADIDDTPSGVTEEHLAWVLEGSSSGLSLRLFVNGEEVRNPEGSTPMIGNVWCIIDADSYPRGRSSPPPPLTQCEHPSLEPPAGASGYIGDTLMVLETLRFGAAAATDMTGPNVQIVHARTYNYPLSLTQINVDNTCADDGSCAGQLGLGAAGDVPATVDYVNKKLVGDEVAPENGLLELEKSVASRLLYKVSGPDETTSYDLTVSTVEDGVVLDSSGTGVVEDEVDITFDNAGVHAIAVETKIQSTGTTSSRHVCAWPLKPSRCWLPARKEPLARL